MSHEDTPEKDARILAAAAHGLTFVEGGLIGPAIVYFAKRDANDFVAFHALQSLLFGLAFLAIALVTCGIGAAVLAIPYMVFEGIATIKAYEGEWYELPIVGRYARERHGAASGQRPYALSTSASSTTA
ncbi:MAG: DUF4870 domain-containing protein [Sandaracinaceae bacterium]|nr:DUF4870 domain-containing protein [Sandaracinaceae bacterium]